MGKVMKSRATVIDGDKSKSFSTQGTIDRKPTRLNIPIRKLEEGEGLVLGFRQEMIAMGKGEHGGSVMTGSGLGTDFIILQWGDREAVVRGSELLRAWVATFSKDSERFPQGIHK